MLRNRWVAVPLSVLVWSSYVLIVIAWTPLVLLFRAFTFPLDRNRLRVGRLFHSSAVIAGTINPFWSFRLSGADSVDARKPHVFVANHGSFTDVFLIVRLPWEMKWLSKEAIFRIPFLGWQMRAAGDVPVLRGDRDSSRRAMERMRRILESGVSVILFPEGTRSALGSLGEFRAGAFRLAIDAGADVVPLAISGAAQSLPKRSAVFRPATPTLAVLPAVSTVGWISDDAPRLAARVRLQIAEALGLGNASRRAVRIR